MKTLSPPQLALLSRLSAGSSVDPVGREHLTGKALVRLGLAEKLPILGVLRITPEGRRWLDSPPEPRGTRRVGIRLPLSCQGHLDRGREKHGTDTAAIVNALKTTYPATS